MVLAEGKGRKKKAIPIAMVSLTHTLSRNTILPSVKVNYKTPSPFYEQEGVGPRGFSRVAVEG